MTVLELIQQLTALERDDATVWTWQQGGELAPVVNVSVDDDGDVVLSETL